MSRDRCTFEIQELDCPTEVDALTAALENAQGIFQLGFDLIHGTMTVDFESDVTNPEAIIARISDRCGMRAAQLGSAKVVDERGAWWARNGRWSTTVGSGLALLVAS